MRAAGVALVLTAAASAPGAAAGWQVDSQASHLTFVGTQSGSSFEGHFGKFVAEIDFDPANPAAGHILVRIDMTSAATGQRERDEALPQPEWFDVKNFPEARFEAKGLRATSPGTFEAPGQITIRGVSKPLLLPFTFHRDGDTARATGQVVLVRSDFGIGQGPWASDQWVGTKVTVNFDLVARAH